MEKFTVSTGRREELRDITGEVAAAVKKAGPAEGFCHVFTPHTTCALTINENADPDVPADVLAGLARLAPARAGYAHAEGNSDAHIKSSLLGCALTVPVSGAALRLGTWQGIFLCEFDGPRTRQVWVSFIAGR